MTLIKSISGIRGTIGGKSGENLTPIEIVKYTSSFATILLKENPNNANKKVVIGRDARISGEMISGLVSNTLISLGIDVIDLGLSTTPTVEIAVVEETALGGIILTASHNPKQWNALKLLNSKGEFIDDKVGKNVLELAETNDINFVSYKELGKIIKNDNYIDIHINKILELPFVDAKAIKKAKFKIALDAVNSTGGIAIIPLLKKLGVETIYEINTEPSGNFAHDPEPLPENLIDISQVVLKNNAHLGFAVDPDVDRLAIICENGEMFGEEYTLVAVSDYILKQKKGNTVSNLSSTKALKDITEKYECKYNSAAVGEVNVVAKMKETNAIIGGEGNGGIIFPELHYGRDALVGIALFLSHLANYGKSCSMLRSTYPDYYISKNKIELNKDIDIDHILEEIQKRYSNYKINTIDGVKIEFDNEWVHLRKSNTEPIVRIYSEADSITTANHLAKKIMIDIKEIVADRRV